MSIRTVVSAIIGLLSLLVVMATSVLAVNAWHRYSSAGTLAKSLPVTRLLLESAGHWAVERGVTNTALQGLQPANQAFLDLISARRKAGDASFFAALASIAAIGDIEEKRSLLVLAREAHAVVQRLRVRVDRDIVARKVARAADLRENWVPAITELIVASQNLRRVFDRDLNDSSVILADLTDLQHFAWIMSEYAGRERAQVSAAIAGNAPISPEGMASLATNRGRVELAWETVRHFSSRNEWPPELKRTVDEVQAEFFSRFDPLRGAVIDAGLKGRAYPVGERAWLAAATMAIDSILNVQRVANDVANQVIGQASFSALLGLGMAAAAFTLAMILAGTSFVIVTRRLVRPVHGMAAAMAALARGDHAVEIPGAGRRDEVGAMAQAMHVFREHAIERHRLEAARETTLRRLKGALDQSIEALGRTVETRDPYTAGHMARVAELSVAIARKMGLPKDVVEGIRLGALVHDIGKIGVPGELLTKPGKLSHREFELIKVHAELGHDIVSKIEFDHPIARIVAEHHERFDGSGYPQGLKGEEILPEARIVAVADVVEAITSHRPYRPALGLDFAVAELKRLRGGALDPVVVDACLALLEDPDFSL